MEKIRLQKILANAGLFSRRKAEDAITEGRVTVNGDVVTELGSKADPDKDIITCDGVRIEPQGKIYLIMNKPAGVITSCSDDRGRKTVIDIVSEEMAKRVFPIGRLDYNTTGLLLLTNDGDFAQTLSHPSHGVVKTYLAKVRGVVTPQTMQKMRTGITVEGEKFRFHDVRVDHATAVNSVLLIELTEGKNHIIKILCQALGHPVAKLSRVAYGPLKLGNLGLGDYRHLEKDEIGSLLAAAKGKLKPKFIPAARQKMGLPNKEAVRRDFAGRPRPLTPQRRNIPERGARPFTPARRDNAERGARPFTPARRDNAERGARPFTPAHRDNAERGAGPFTPAHRDNAERGARPFTPARRDNTERGDRTFAPSRRDVARRSGSPFASPHRNNAAYGDRTFTERNSGTNRKPAKPFSPRASGSKRR